MDGNPTAAAQSKNKTPDPVVGGPGVTTGRTNRIFSGPQLEQSGASLAKPAPPIQTTPRVSVQASYAVPLAKAQQPSLAPPPGPAAVSHSKASAHARGNHSHDQGSVHTAIPSVHTHAHHPKQPKPPPQSAAPTRPAPSVRVDPVSGLGRSKPKPPAAARGHSRSQSCWTSSSGEAFTEDQLDKKAIEELKRYRARVEEWKTLDYIPDEDVNSFSEDTYKLAGELLHTNPELYAKLTEADMPFDDDCKNDYAAGTKEMSFNDFIAKKQSAMNEGSDDVTEQTPPVKAPGPGSRDYSAYAFSGGEEEEEPEPVEPVRESKNIIRIPDSEDLLDLPGVGTLKPVLPREEFNSVGMIASNNPGQFLRDPNLLKLPSVRNLEAFLNKYRLNKDVDVFNEKILTLEFAEEILTKVQSCYSTNLEPSGISFVFFIERPLFVRCVFRRRKDKEKVKSNKPGEQQEVNRDRRKYSWAGHRYLMGRDSVDDPEPPKPLPPSNLSLPRIKVPDQESDIYSNTNKSLGRPSPAVQSNVGWE